MSMNMKYAKVEPSRAEIDAMEDALLLEFGTPWCGYCKAAQPMLAAAFAGHPAVQHIKIEDGKGRRLGRSFRVTLWPTLVFLRGGKERERLVRPHSAEQIAKALGGIDSGD
jgi:thioredoxin 1